MVDSPELDDFRKRTRQLLKKKPLKGCLKGGELQLGTLSLEDVSAVISQEEGLYLLQAAAGLTRTTLKTAQKTAVAKVVAKVNRRAFAIKDALPLEVTAESVIEKSVALRRRDLHRKQRGKLEVMFKERLQEEGIPIFMSPPLRTVPGILISSRKPDGVSPEPGSGEPPALYLEIKNINRVSDDIQKRLYEIAEVALEMKLLYGGLELKGYEVASTREVIERREELQLGIRKQILKAKPVVVAFFLCSRSEAERYRPGAQAFIDEVFFQEEVEECIEFLRTALA